MQPSPLQSSHSACRIVHMMWVALSLITYHCHRRRQLRIDVLALASCFILFLVAIWLHRKYSSVVLVDKAESQSEHAKRSALDCIVKRTCADSQSKFPVSCKWMMNCGAFTRVRLQSSRLQSGVLSPHIAVPKHRPSRPKCVVVPRYGPMAHSISARACPIASINSIDSFPAILSVHLHSV